ncbi:MAG: TIGR04283 family arsenosugar biosynthesis glycosyltransferase [Magnetococcus sp. DMHC-6]
MALTVPSYRAELPGLTVIIPTWHEKACLHELLADLQRQVGLTLEIIVVDGGSRSLNQEQAAFPGVHWLNSARGRGVQMNTGAQHATCEELLFLHADSRLHTENLLQQAYLTMEKRRAQCHPVPIAGHFSIQFRRQKPGAELAYRFYEKKSQLNRPECYNGDQGLWLSRSFFQQLGGFDQRFSFLEDRQMAIQIRQKGMLITLPGSISTSARRFEQEGLARRQILNALILACLAIGFQEFLFLAPELYKSQEQTERLNLMPYVQLLHRLNQQAGWKVALRFGSLFFFWI